MTVRIKLPEELARYCGGRDESEVEAATFEAVLARLIEQFPDVGPRLLGRGGHLLSHLIVFRNGSSVPAPKLPKLAVTSHDELEIMFLASGG